MDPNNNSMPGMSPAPAAPTLAPTGASMPAMGVAAPAPAAPPTTSSMPLMGAAPAAPAMPTPAPSAADLNPAVSVANAAMAGAEANVVTPDIENGTIPPAPMTTLPIPPEDEPTGPVNLAPSAGFEAPEVATVSAVQNGANPDLASQEMPDPMSQDPLDNPMPNPNQEQSVDFNSGDGTNGEENTEKEENTEPIEAAAPVPGSIGSAKSYIDIQRAEAERAAKMATKKEGKFNISGRLIAIIGVVVALVIGLVVMLIMMNSGSKPATPTPVTPDTPEVVMTELSCKRSLAIEEYNWTGAIGGDLENIFYFADDELDGLVTNFKYAFATTEIAGIAKNNLSTQYGIVEQPVTPEGYTEEVEGEAVEAPVEEKTTEQMLKQDVSIDDTIVTHHLEITSDDIKAWVASDAYSDATYGAEKTNAIVCPDGTKALTLEKCQEEGHEAEVEEAEEEPTRNLDYFRTLQNRIGFSCTVSK